MLRRMQIKGKQAKEFMQDGEDRRVRYTPLGPCQFPMQIHLCQSDWNAPGNSFQDLSSQYPDGRMYRGQGVYKMQSPLSSYGQEAHELYHRLNIG